MFFKFGSKKKREQKQALADNREQSQSVYWPVQETHGSLQEVSQSEKERTTPKNEGFQGTIDFFVKLVVLVAFIVMPVRFFLFSPFIIKGQSMEPNFRDSEYLIIDEISYRFHQPMRGDVVVFRYPKDTTQFYIKRIIGLPGETVEVDSGRVILYNKENPSGIEMNETQYLDKDLETLGQQKMTLGDDEYFVLGDNRSQSSDSRVWGVLPKNDIVGRAWVRVLPFDRFSVYRPISYSFVGN